MDFYLGGGQKSFTERNSYSRDFISDMRSRGRVVESYFDKTIDQLQARPELPYGYFTSFDDPLPAAQGRDYLAPASKLALEYLSARDQEGRGFFLVVEGSQIDWGGHANSGEYIVSEVQDFSRSLDVVLDWAASDGNTLVVVTADHETGGFAVNYGSRPDSMIYAFTSDYHTATMVPVFAHGPGDLAFSGIYENTEIYTKLLNALNSAVVVGE